MLIGARGDDALLRDFLNTHFEIIPLDREVADETVRLRRLYRVRLPDAIIWATARVHQAILVTRNARDFHPNWEGIRVLYSI
ncbi:MAG: PIN domain-containing protein [Thermoflexus sp.]|nr:PIN domain-containing protein [Thermoflexus sp.]